VLDSDPKTSLAKSPNAQLVALYTILQADFFGRQAAVSGPWREMYETIQGDRLSILFAVPALSLSRYLIPYFLRR
jgi:hypothetical protein